MKIWCISKYASLPLYGPAARLFFLAKEFAGQGHEVLLLTSDSNHLANYPESKQTYNFDTIDGVRTCWVKTKKYQKTASLERILSWFDFEWKLFLLSRKNLFAPDVILVSSLSIFSIVYGYFLSRKYKAKLIFEIRDIWPLTMTEEAGFSSRHPLVLFIGLVEKFGYKRADLIAGTMPRLDLHVKNILGYERPFFCSPLGFSEKQLENSSADFSDSFPKNKIIVGYAGSMGVSNNLDPYMKCIRSYANDDRVHFVLVGGGDYREKYEKELSAQKNVNFLPKIKPSEVQSFLSHCDILYLSTHASKVWDFGQSMNKVVEYMLSGKPIIASFSGYPSMINEADCGVFVPADNDQALQAELNKMISMDSSVREEMGARGRSWILANRSYSKLAAEYLDTMRAL